MWLRFIFLILFVLALASSALPISFPVSSATFSGRTMDVMAKDSNSVLEVRFDNPGTSFSFSVSNTSEVSISMSQNVDPAYSQPNYFSVIIDEVIQPGSDGCLSSTFNTQGWENQVKYNLLIANKLDPNIIHTITVFKLTEAQFNQINVRPNAMSLHEIILGGPSPQIMKNEISQSPERKIEFIGDSITAGFCNLCDSSCDIKTGAGLESHFASWPAIISRSLNAEFHTIAWSGYGLLNNCCGGTTHMPEVYQRTLSSDPSSPSWNFSRWIPDAVVVNLGTNDFGSGRYDEKSFVAAYVDLATNITKVYGSNVSLFLACGPMSSSYCAGVHKTIAVVNQLPSLVAPKATYFLDQADLSVELNCCGHPSSADDLEMAESGAAFIKNAMQWD